ncbi:NADPH-dependent FMN reductase [Prauserella muralis]|uniref:FMN reductase n=1 Tax=Prauserella muralis TaxID=588067 RepID=A0A2V4B6D3_9PSEU|nr:NADPH-dependent FMN reductase [Prauserella muralis]PXY24695.1 FMN reductase [Prauserella muralis]TWE27612.1 FMN reductase [Prauserella muralis]
MPSDARRSATPVRILAFGGSTRPGSSSEIALRTAAAAAEARGATVELMTGPELLLPLYQPDLSARTEQAHALLASVRSADGIIIASPGYHGAVSGMIKNALDYVEDLRGDARVYLDGRAVGCIGVAHGWQAAVSTLHSLRVVVHALRGWPTPLGVAVNGAEGIARNEPQFVALAEQVVRFAEMQTRAVEA